MSNQMFLCQTSFSNIFFGLSSTEFHPHWIQTEGKDIFQSHPFPQSFTKVYKNIFVFSPTDFSFSHHFKPHHSFFLSC